MKKLMLVAMAACLSFTTMSAQESDSKESVLFKHLAIGVNGGTNGLGIDLATTLTPQLEMRIGWDAMSRFTTTTHLYTNSIKDATFQWDDTKVDFDARSNMKTMKLLLDIYPSKNSAFRITAGVFYSTNDKVAQAENVNLIEEFELVHAYNNEPGRLQAEKIGVNLGDYFLEPDANGLMHASFCVNRIQPYLGIGFGRVVPSKNKLTLSMDFGLKFWGKPSIKCNDIPITSDNINENTENKVLKILSNLSVYPVINIRLAGKLF